MDAPVSLGESTTRPGPCLVGVAGCQRGLANFQGVGGLVELSPVAWSLPHHQGEPIQALLIDLVVDSVRDLVLLLPVLSVQLRSRARSSPAGPGRQPCRPAIVAGLWERSWSAQKTTVRKNSWSPVRRPLNSSPSTGDLVVIAEVIDRLPGRIDGGQR